MKPPYHPTDDAQESGRDILAREPPWEPGLLSGHGGDPVDALWRVAVHRVRRRQYYHHGDPPWVRRAILFLKGLLSCRGEADRLELAARMPELDAAYRVHATADKLARGTVEARLLAGQTLEETADACGLSREAVEAYHALFFDVMGKLKARTYIQIYAIGMQYFLEPSEEDVDAILKRVAFLRGPIMLEMFLRYYRTPIVLPKRLDDLTREQLEELSELLLTRLIIMAWVLPPEKMLRVTLFQGLLHQLHGVIDTWPGPGGGAEPGQADSPSTPADREAWWRVWRQAVEEAGKREEGLGSPPADTPAL